MIRGELEAILQNGLFGCLIDCTEGPQRQLLEWICLNTDSLKDVNKRQDLINGLGKNIGNYFVDLVGDPKGKIDRSIEHMVHQIQNLIPRDMLTLSGLDAHFSSGQLWLELERQNNGTFTVLVYGTGQALSYYKQNEKGEFTWPKRIEGVTYSKLNVDFFERFLFHRIEPGYDPEVISKAEHFFEGLLSYLEPDTVPINQKKINTASQVDATINTPNAMAKQLLINPKHSLKRVQFEFRLQAFMDYCRPLFSPTQELKNST